jgi:aspartyl-tRNA(Asn)/glutamyl-tRNA(Gln) amidotransferase subunit A
MGDDIVFAPIAELAGLYRRRAVTPVEATRLFLDRIARFDPELHAFITVAADQALADARTAERRLADGDDSPLVGVPIAVKDALATRGVRTTGNSRLLEHWVPDSDAAAVARLRAAGAVLVGKTNLNEFGWASLTPAHAPRGRGTRSTRPLARRWPAVSAGLVTAALGTDGGGSVRLPGGQMGLVGCKATQALISRVGSLHAGTLSNIGPLARTVEDAAILLNSMAVYDAADPDARPRPQVDYTHGLGDRIAGIRVGVPWGYIESVPVEPDVRTAFDAALADLTRLGAIISRVELPALEHARTANFVVLNAEHYLAHETVLRSHWARHGRSARLYLAQAAFLSSSDYLRAREVGWLVRGMVDGFCATSTCWPYRLHR